MFAVFLIGFLITLSELLVLLHQQNPDWWRRPGARVGANNPDSANLLFGGISVYLTLMVAIVRAPAWLLALAGIFLFIAFLPVARRHAKTVGKLTLYLVGRACLIAWLQWYIYQETRPRLQFSLAVITTIDRIKDPSGGYMRGGQNDLLGILRVRQKNGLHVHHVNSLRIKGDISADFNSYIAAFSKENGTETIDDLARQYASQKPFFHIYWVVHPDTHEKIDTTDEEFIRITISRSGGAIQMPPGGQIGKVSEDAFGSYTAGVAPKLALTMPVWSQLAEFTSTNPKDLTGIYPRLRDEVKTGKVAVSVDMDGEIINIPAKNIFFPWATSLPAGMQSKWRADDLFYGVDADGSINALPSRTNPLAEKEDF